MVNQWYCIKLNIVTDYEKVTLWLRVISCILFPLSQPQKNKTLKHRKLTQGEWRYPPNAWTPSYTFHFSSASLYTGTGWPKSPVTPQNILTGWRYQYYTSIKSIIIFVMYFMRDENCYPNFYYEKEVKRKENFVFNGNPNIVTYRIGKLFLS